MKIRFERSSSYYGSLIKMKIHIDGVLIGSLGVSQKFEYDCERVN